MITLTRAAGGLRARRYDPATRGMLQQLPHMLLNSCVSPEGRLIGCRPAAAYRSPFGALARAASEEDMPIVLIPQQSTHTYFLGLSRMLQADFLLICLSSFMDQAS